MILLATNKRDITTDFVVLELQRRAIPFVRLNTEDLPNWLVRFDPCAGWTFAGDGHSLQLGDVIGAYYRRPLAPAPLCDPADQTAVAYCTTEWTAALRSLWSALDGRWLNSPFAINQAEDKPRQLAMASTLGFDVPGTLVTNDFDEATAFVRDGGIVAKPLRHALLEDDGPGSVIFTNRIASLDETDRAAFGLAPVILQREVRKDCDIRVTVVGDRLFVAEISSQVDANTKVDWRRGSNPTLPHSAVDLPSDVARLCVEITKRLGLRFGAIDLIRDKEGRHWFLEINPNGQWAWIEKRTGHPIAAAIVDLLTANAR